MINDEMAEGNATTIADFGHFEAGEHKGQRVVGLDGQECEVESRDALGIQLQGPVIAFRVLTDGVLQISLGLAAGAMFVLSRGGDFRFLPAAAELSRWRSPQLRPDLSE